MNVEGIEVVPGGKKLLDNGLPVEMLEFATTTGCVRDYYQRDVTDVRIGQLQEFSKLAYTQLPISVLGESGFTEWIETTDTNQRNRAHRSIFAQCLIGDIPARVRLEFLDESRQNNSLQSDGLRYWGTAMFRSSADRTTKISYGVDPQERPTFKLSYFYPDPEVKRRFDFIIWVKGMALLSLGRQFDQVRGVDGFQAVKDHDVWLKAVGENTTVHDRTGQTIVETGTGSVWKGQISALNSPFYGQTSINFYEDSIQILGESNSTRVGLIDWITLFEGCTSFCYESALIGLARLLNRLSLQNNSTSLVAETKSINKGK